MTDFSELAHLDATAQADLVRRKDVQPIELVDAAIDRIEALNPKLNAVVTNMFDQARETARGELPEGPFTGVPFLLKDVLGMCQGVPMTMGSALLRDFVPDHDSELVSRLRRAGLIFVGKTNVPEFGLGSHTFNSLFGATRNPYNPARTAGGSSGGAAAALASGMVPIADGSDLGGSLRNPAGFCNITGFRTSPGRVPKWPTTVAWAPFSVQGPMARTVADIALMLSAIAGPDPRFPISIAEPAEIFSRPMDRDFKNTRIAWSMDLSGLPVDPRVRTIQEAKGLYAPNFDTAKQYRI